MCVYCNTVRVLITRNLCTLCEAAPNGPISAIGGHRAGGTYGHPVARGTTWGRQICLSRKCPTNTLYYVRSHFGFFGILRLLLGGIKLRFDFSSTTARKHPSRPNTTRRRPWLCWFHSLHRLIHRPVKIGNLVENLRAPLMAPFPST